MAGRHRTSGPQPGDPGWTHPDVKGETDPAKIKAELDRIQGQENREQVRIQNMRNRG